MTASEFALLVVAGVAAGLVGSIAGLASLISYPALLGVGLGPVAANVTNTVALVFVGIGSVLGSQPELKGQGPRLRRLAIAALLGGAAGGALLLATPASAFERVVPVLIGLASLAILRRPSRSAHPHVQGGRDSRALPPAVFTVAIYGGYFGAAAGVLMLALFLAMTHEPIARSNALKTALLGVTNSVAALGFILFGPVDWAAVVPLALGFFAGGRLGPAAVRRAPAEPLRILVAVSGLAVAARLGWQAYR